MGLDGAPRPPNLASGFARKPRRPRISRLQKKCIIGLSAIIIVAIILIPSFIPGTHTSSIERVAGSEDEMDALLAAEEMDMASYLGMDRFSRSGINDFRWSYATDGETVEFYQEIIDEMDRSRDTDDANFEYTSECQHVDRVLLFPHPIPVLPGGVYIGQLFTMESSNANADFESYYRYMDLDHLPNVGKGYLLEDAYIIRQHLRFDYWPSDEYHLIIEQLVILDGDLDLMVLMSDPEWREIPICYG